MSSSTPNVTRYGLPVITHAHKSWAALCIKLCVSLGLSYVLSRNNYSAAFVWATRENFTTPTTKNTGISMDSMV
jgi:hypothetical protein